MERIPVMPILPFRLEKKENFFFLLQILTFKAFARGVRMCARVRGQVVIYV